MSTEPDIMHQLLKFIEAFQKAGDGAAVVFNAVVKPIGEDSHSYGGMQVGKNGTPFSAEDMVEADDAIAMLQFHAQKLQWAYVHGVAAMVAADIKDKTGEVITEGVMSDRMTEMIEDRVRSIQEGAAKNQRLRIERYLPKTEDKS